MTGTTTTTTTALVGFSKEREDMPSWGYFSKNDVASYPGAVPTEDVVKLMDYPLHEASLTASWIDNDGVNSSDLSDRKAIVRGDTGQTFGIFKNGYQIHQPKEWLIQNLELLLDDGLQVGQARLIRGGAIAFVQVEMPDSRDVEGVKYRPYFTAVTSHDGSLATSYFTGNIVLNCENQLGQLRREASSAGALMKIRHSSQSLGRISEARSRLGLIVEEAGDAFDEEVRQLTSEYVSDARWAEFVDAFTGVEKAKEGRSKTIAEGKVKTLNTMWNTDERVAPWKNNAWGVLSAVNTSLHHEFGAKKTREERNAMRTVTGAWDKLDSNTLALLATV